MAMNRLVVLLVAALSVICAAACTGGVDDRHATPVSADEAARFGGVSLPDDVEILGASTEGAIDTLYELALRVTAAQLHELIAKSHFITPATSSDYGKDRPVLGGPPMSSATDLRYAQDRVDTIDHQGVVRELFEDHRSPDEIYVHLFMFTT
jgi:hypothetical protein